MSGKLRFASSEGSEQQYDFTMADLEDVGTIGQGTFGCVHRMIHIPSTTSMAVKV